MAERLQLVKTMGLPGEAKRQTGSHNAQVGTVFDPVKRDLGVILLIALAATLLISRLDAPDWVELSVLAAVGLGCGAWLALRTHRIAYAFRDNALGSGHGDDTRSGGDRIVPGRQE